MVFFEAAIKIFPTVVGLCSNALMPEVFFFFFFFFLSSFFVCFFFKLKSLFWFALVFFVSPRDIDVVSGL